MHFQSILGALLLLVAPGMSQFFNFGNMFGQQQQHQEPQNMGSDSDWYQQNYEGGKRIRAYTIRLSGLADVPD